MLRYLLDGLAKIMNVFYGEKEDLSTPENYSAARDALIRDELSAAAGASKCDGYSVFDAAAVRRASSLELQANQIIQHVKKLDEVQIYGTQSTTGMSKGVVGDQFLKNLDLIEQTRLMKIAQRMPKGGHLHCHYNACLHPSFLIKHARGMKSMYIRSTMPLTSELNFGVCQISFQVLSPQNDLGNIFSTGYRPQTWMSYPDFCEKFEGGIDAAERWLISKVILTEEQVYHEQQSLHG